MSNKMLDVVQIKNPKTGRYIKIDRDTGRILSYKVSTGAYKNIPIARRKLKKFRGKNAIRKSSLLA